MTTTHPALHPSSTTSTDPRPLFARASELACQVAASVRPDQLGGPTPCTDYDVRELLGHTVAVLRRVAAVGRSADPHSVAQVTTGVADDGWGAAAREAALDLEQVWSDDAVLGRMLRLPFATLPGAVALAVYTAELTTHTWDIAVATGQRPSWNDEVASAALAGAQRALPAEHRGGEIPFGPVVPVPDTAPVIERLVAWQGRDPRWSPAG